MWINPQALPDLPTATARSGEETWAQLKVAKIMDFWSCWRFVVTCKQKSNGLGGLYGREDRGEKEKPGQGFTSLGVFTFIFRLSNVNL